MATPDKSFSKTNVLLLVMLMISVLTFIEIRAISNRFDEGVLQADPLLFDDKEVVQDPQEKEGFIHLVEFFDYQCPYCRMAQETIKDLKERYGDRLVLEYMHFPLPSHTGAFLAAQAAECAREQGAFELYHEYLFMHQNALAEDDLQKYAQELKLDMTRFISCLESDATKSSVEKHIAAGFAKGVTGTPAFFIDGKSVQGAQPAQVFVSIIEGTDTKEGTKEIETVELDDKGDPSLGSKDAPVVMYEFSDFQCPFCARFYSQIFPQLKQEYIDTGKVRFVYKDFPLGFHANAKPAAIAASCAKERFWEFHDRIFGNQAMLSEQNLLKWAQELDIKDFAVCINDPAMAAEVDEDALQGSSNGISGTPGFIINGEVVEGAMPFEVFKQVIEGKLEGNP